jgi:hypothetical protein
VERLPSSIARISSQGGAKKFLEGPSNLPSASSDKVCLLCETVFGLPRYGHNIEQLIFRRGGAIIPQGNFLILELVKCHFQHFRGYTCILMRFDDFK